MIAKHQQIKTITSTIEYINRIPYTELLSGCQIHKLYGYRLYSKDANL